MKETMTSNKKIHVSKSNQRSNAKKKSSNSLTNFPSNKSCTTKEIANKGLVTPDAKTSSITLQAFSENEIMIDTQSADQVLFVIEGDPYAHKQRNNRKNGGFYNPNASAMTNFKKKITEEVSFTPLHGPVSVNYMFHFTRPDAERNVMMLRKGKQVTYKNVNPLYPSCKPYPDIDNLVNFANDALNNSVYVDDVQIVRLTATKLYSDGYPRTSILVKSALSEVEKEEANFKEMFEMFTR